MSTNSTKFNPMVLVVLMIVALVGFMVTAFYYVQQELTAVNLHVNDIDNKVAAQVTTLNDQINKRYLTLLKMAEDLSLQQGKLITIDRTIGAEREALAKLQENFRADLAQIKKMGGEQGEVVTKLEQQFKSEIRTKEAALSKLQDDYENLKGQVDNQSALLVMIREKDLLQQYGTSGSGGSSSAPSPAPMTPSSGPGTLVPPTPVAPVPSGSGVISPQNNRVVTDLPSPGTDTMTPAPAPTLVLPLTQPAR